MYAINDFVGIAAAHGGSSLQWWLADAYGDIVTLCPVRSRFKSNLIGLMHIYIDPRICGQFNIKCAARCRALSMRTVFFFLVCVCAFICLVRILA